MVETLKPNEEQKDTRNMTVSQIRREIIINSNNFTHINEGNIKSFYKIQSCIGRSKLVIKQRNCYKTKTKNFTCIRLGSGGEVRRCISKETNAQRAVKIINKKKMKTAAKEKLLSEISILKELDHPNIVKLYEFFQDPKRYFLVTELCQGGELFERIA